jgi:hypothetical protein
VTFPDALGIAGFVILCAVAAWTLPNYWRGVGFTFTRRPPGWWGLGAVLWHGFLRSYPVLVGTAWVGVADMMVLTVSASSSPSGKASDGVVTTMIGGFICGLAVAGSVVLLNWPRLVVPPRFRSDLGAVAEWRLKRSRR